VLAADSAKSKHMRSTRSAMFAAMEWTLLHVFEVSM
jgi:hypothetical protein